MSMFNGGSGETEVTPVVRDFATTWTVLEKSGTLGQSRRSPQQRKEPVNVSKYDFR